MENMFTFQNILLCILATLSSLGNIGLEINQNIQVIIIFFLILQVCHFSVHLFCQLYASEDNGYATLKTSLQRTFYIIQIATFLIFMRFQIFNKHAQGYRTSIFYETLFIGLLAQSLTEQISQKSRIQLMVLCFLVTIAVVWLLVVVDIDGENGYIQIIKFPAYLLVEFSCQYFADPKLNGFDSDHERDKHREHKIKDKKSSILSEESIIKQNSNKINDQVFSFHPKLQPNFLELEDVCDIDSFVLNKSNIGVCAYNSEGSLTYSNKQIEDILECEPDRILQQVTQFFREQGIQSQKSLSQGENLFNRKIGQVQSFLLNLKNRQCHSFYPPADEIRLDQNSNDFSFNDKKNFSKQGGDDEFDIELIPDGQNNQQKNKNIVNLVSLIEIGIRQDSSPRIKFQSSVGSDQYIKQGSNRSNESLGINQSGEENYEIQLEISNNRYKIQLFVWQCKKGEQYLVFSAEKVPRQMEIKNSINLLSHQLRSPLNCSIGLLEISKNLNIGDQFKNQYILPILNSNYYLLNNLNNIIDVSEIELREFKYEIEKIQIRDLLNDVTSILLFESQQKNIQFILQTSVYLEDFWSDSKRLRQVLINIISNSIKYSHQHGIIQIKVDIIKQLKRSTVKKFQQRGTPNFQAENQADLEEKMHDQLKQANIADKESEKSTRNIKITIKDHGRGMNCQDLQKIMRQTKRKSTWEFQDLNYQKIHEMRTEGFGIKSAVKILQGLAPEQYKTHPLKIKSELNAGCIVEIRVRDFKIDIESANSSPSQQRCYDLNVNEKQYLIQQFQSNEFDSQVECEYGGVDLEEKPSNFLFVDEDSERKEDENLSLRDQENEIQSTPRESVDLYKKMRSSSLFIGSKKQDEIYFIQQSMTRDDSNSKSDQNNRSETHFNLNDFNVLKDLKSSDILVVDDNYFNVLTIQCIFEELNTSLDQCYNGLEAVEKFQMRFYSNNNQSVYQLIIMDIDMPVMNGFQASKEILQFCQQNNLKTNIVACSAFISTEDVQFAKDLGMMDYITKPVNQKVISDVLKKYLFN